MKKLIAVAFLFFSVITLSISQDDLTDSLSASLQTAADDSNKVNTLIALSKSYYSADPKLSVSYGEEAKKLADQIKFPKGAAFALKSIGIAHYWNGNDVEAISNWEMALAVFDSIGDKIGAANMYGNMGGVFFDRGDDAKALELHLKSLEFSEEVNDTFRIASALINIGTVYANKTATHDTALAYYQRALVLSEYLGDQEAIGVTCVNLGEIYFVRNEDSIALKYFERSLRAYEGSENIPYSLNYIGKVYARKGDYQKAIEYQQQAFGIAQKTDVKNDMAITLLGMASTYEMKGDTKSALQAYLQAEKIATEIDASYKLEEAYRGLSLAYDKLGDINNAFKYQSLLISIKDTIYNIEYDRKVAGLQFKYDLGKKQGEVDLLTKDKELQAANLKREKLVKNAFMAGLFLIAIIAFVIFRNYRQKAKANKIISYQKGEIENLLLNILPAEVAHELRQTGHATPRHYDSVSVLFTDFKGFTNIAEGLSPAELINQLGSFFEAFDKIIEKNNLEKIKTIGDAYMCAGGIPTANQTHPLDIVKAGLEIQQYINDINGSRTNNGNHRWDIRIGIHTGPVVAGVVGSKKYAYDIWGDTVNIASRMESSGEPGKVNISGATYELVKGSFHCIHRGKIMAKNKGEIDMYFVESNGTMRGSA